ADDAADKDPNQIHKTVIESLAGILEDIEHRHNRGAHRARVCQSLAEIPVTGHVIAPDGVERDKLKQELAFGDAVGFHDDIFDAARRSDLAGLAFGAGGDHEALAHAEIFKERL